MLAHFFETFAQIAKIVCDQNNVQKSLNLRKTSEKHLETSNLLILQKTLNLIFTDLVERNNY